MMEDLAYLPAWYGESEDYVLTDKTEPQLETFQNQLSTTLALSFPVPISRERLQKNKTELPPCEAHAWGLSPQAVAYFRNLRQEHLQIPEWKDIYRKLTGRQTAAHCLQLMKEALPSMKFPDLPRFCTSLAEVEAFLNQHRGQTCLLKSPFSSSGRGLLWLPNGQVGKKETDWTRGVIEKQGAVSLEVALDKRLDCAMEFYADGNGSICYEGLSAFGTGERGTYSGNRLGSDDYREQFLQTFIPAEAETIIRENLQECLRKIFATHYKGYLGVDMLVYQDNNGQYRLHPCVEINMRYTMGMVALQLSRHFLAPGATGLFRIEYEKETGKALALHRKMKTEQPLILTNRKIESGYLSLCPVSEKTHYRAFIEIQPA